MRHAMTQTIRVQGGLAPACAGDQLTSQARVGVCAAVPSTHALSHIHLNHWASGRTQRGPLPRHTCTTRNRYLTRPDHHHTYRCLSCLPQHTQHTHDSPRPSTSHPCCSAGTSSSWLMCCCCAAHLLPVLPPLHTPQNRKRTPGPHAKETTHNTNSSSRRSTRSQPVAQNP